MVRLIKNELYKLKRQYFLIFELLLTLMPVVTGGLASLMNKKYSFMDLFFFVNNQFAMFYPMVVFMVVSTLFYSEYKNRTYITWISYEYKKKDLFLSKLVTSIIIDIIMAIILFILLITLAAVLSFGDVLHLELNQVWNVFQGICVEIFFIIPCTVVLGAIFINLSRNIVISSIVGIFWGFFSCLFIGLENGYFVPGAFGYRICMSFFDRASFYKNGSVVFIRGSLSFIIQLAVLFGISFFIFTKKKKVER